MSEKVLITGNDAIGEAAIRAGCDCYFGYPITPQNELTAYMAANMLEKKRVFIQAESELAAINMVFGASSAGARAMTSSSSPGISLKQEGISYMAAARLPGVIVNVQRGGPGLGGIGPSQSDYFQAVKGGGHGDYHTIVLAPSTVQEMHDLTIEAFRLSEQYRTPSLILADGRLGQMMEPVTFFEGELPGNPDRDWILTGADNRPGRVVRSLFVDDAELEAHNVKLQECYAEIKERETRYDTFMVDDCSVLVCAWGTCARIAKGAVRRARAEGIKAGLFRPITVWPYPYAALGELARQTGRMLVVEMNSGQMVEDARIAANGSAEIFFKGYLGSRVPSESEIFEELKRISHE